jgi:hypothetical protein
MTEYEKLDQLLNALKAGEPVKGSTSELWAVGLAAERPELLSAPYNSPGEAWRRLNAWQRTWVRQTNPDAALDAKVKAEHAKTAWHRQGRGSVAEQPINLFWARVTWIGSLVPMVTAIPRPDSTPD